IEGVAKVSVIGSLMAYPGGRSNIPTTRHPMAAQPLIKQASMIDDEDFGSDRIGIEAEIRQILLKIGEGPDRDGLLRTPLRVDKAFAYLTSGYRADVQKILNNAIFEEANGERFDEMVIVKDIEFYSLCEHHMIPFFGKVHIAYV